MSQPQKPAILTRDELIKRLEKFRGPYLGDGINLGIDIPSLLAALTVDLNAIQRYNVGIHVFSGQPGMGTYDDGEYVRYDEVKKLLG